MYRTSIIIPAYNSEETIEPCLGKIINESKNFISEIIVVDDNSNDKTVEIVKKIKSVKIWSLSQKNRNINSQKENKVYKKLLNQPSASNNKKQSKEPKKL